MDSWEIIEIKVQTYLVLNPFVGVVEKFNSVRHDVTQSMQEIII
jgi:hypothetical protein